jgi:hypothetical protein
MPDDATGGLLYINLVEARNLPSKATDFYLKTCGVAPLGESNHLGLQTSTSHGARDPAWYEEQVFTIRDRSKPIRLQVWEAHRVRSDKLLGHIQLEISPMSHFLMYDLWLPLVGADGSSTGETVPKLRALAQFSPMKTGELINIKLNPLRLQLQKQYYTAGENVRGQVVLSTPEAFADSQVIVRLVGTQHTSWSESHDESYTDSDGSTKSRTVSVWYGDAKVLVKEERTCLDKTAVDKKEAPAIAPGFYVWPFEFQIPAKICPSFESSYGAVAFSVEAFIYRPKKSKILQKTKASLNVISPVETLAVDAPTPAFEKLPLSSGDQDVSIEVLCDNPIYILGQQRTTLVKIINNSKKSLTKGKVSLRAHMNHSDGGSNSKYVTHDATSISYDGAPFPIAAGESRELTVVFEPLLSSVPSTSTDTSPLIDVKYSIHVSVEMDGFFSSRVRADRAVVVCQPPQDISPPKAYPLEQPIQELMKEYGFGLPVFPSELHHGHDSK